MMAVVKKMAAHLRAKLADYRAIAPGAAGQARAEGEVIMAKSRIGLSKEEVRRIVLSNLRIVYRDWRMTKPPFWRRSPKPGNRRGDARSFETALLAALLGGVSEAIERNNHALFTALGRKDQQMARRRAR